MRRIGFVLTVGLIMAAMILFAGLAFVHVNANGNEVDIEAVSEYVPEYR